MCNSGGGLEASTEPIPWAVGGRYCFREAGSKRRCYLEAVGGGDLESGKVGVLSSLILESITGMRAS